MAQLRSTVERYLTAQSPQQRCALLTTVYRTMNPEVLLAGGCDRSEQLSAAERAALRASRIERVQVQGSDATVTLAPAAGSDLTALELTVEHGEWRINGFVARSSGSTSGSAPS